MDGLTVKPDIICVQETWLKPHVDFVLQGYTVIRQDRKNGSGGGCATVVKNGVQYRILKKDGANEFLVVGAWCKDKEIAVLNIYNPCQRLEMDVLLHRNKTDPL